MKDILKAILGPVNQGDFAKLAVFKSFGDLDPLVFAGQMEDILVEAIKFQNDQAVLTALNILAQLGAYGVIKQSDLDLKMQSFYWQMPYGVEEYFNKKLSPILVESKKFILQRTINSWCIFNHDSGFKGKAKILFEFFISCYTPIPQNAIKIEFESDEDFKIRSTAVFESNKKMIEDIFRDALKNVPPDNIKVWIEGYVPWELSKIMGLAWARNGGWKELIKK